jgi:uncharacterized protein YacL
MARDRSVWNLNRDEQRTMMITVVGGLVSFLLGVAVVAVALTLVRAMKAHPGPTNVAAVIFFLVGTATANVAVLSTNRLRDKGWRFWPRKIQVIVAALFLLFGLYALVLLGYAAGVK